MKSSDEEIQDLHEEIDDLKVTIKELTKDIRLIEMRVLINKKDIATINKQLERIKMNTTWSLRIIIGAVLTGVVGLIIKVTL
ncbi:hemolysin XhlA family protein [Bacillus sp. TL12]|uniref:hemolysin XhlA family protein n=1 Tax=Bacillus sp. TL12 TaxID=2894756 RepID=UPI001F52A703|nr:hemolysin XhlA family protein [Bacillus sp. TL12]MCI0764952.1 hemolysin XhlA family protein [Bacillus sp. TL12]